MYVIWASISTRTSLCGHKFQQESFFICLALQLLLPKFAKFLEILWKFRSYSSSRSPKVIDHGANLKYIWSFLLVINCNIGRISYRFWDTDAFCSKIARFPHPTLVWRSLAEVLPVMSTHCMHHWKVHLMGYNFVADNNSFVCIATIGSQICKISWNSQRIQTYSRSSSSILVSIESAYATS